MPQLTEAQRNQEAVNFANSKEKKVAPSLKKKVAIGSLVVGTIAGALGIGNSPEKSEPTDMGTASGQMAGGTVENGTKGAAPASPFDPESVDPATKEAVAYKNSEAFASNDGAGAVEAERSAADETSSMTIDPATGEAKVYEESEAFAANDGHKAANIEREANNPEG